MKFKNLRSELAIYLKQAFRFRNAWIVLPGITALLLVYMSHHFGVADWILEKDFHEQLALGLVAAIFIVLTVKSIFSRDPVMIYLAALSLIFCFRELDDANVRLYGREFEIESKKAVDVLLVWMGLWGVMWHERIFSTLNRSTVLKIGLFGVLWGYLFSQLIARRAFERVLPLEELLHVPMEETSETVAHIFFIVFALVCCFVVPHRGSVPKSAKESILF